MDDARRAFLRLCAAAILAYCSYSICRTPILPLFARELGATPPLVGLVMGASTLTGVFLKFPSGAWSDVIGRRPLLLAGAAVFASLPFTYLLVPSVFALIAVRCVHGSATAIFGPVASASISDAAPAGARGAWLSTYATVQGVGQAIGPIAAGYLLALGGFDAVFLAAGVIGLSAPLLLLGWRDRREPQPSHSRWRQLREGASAVMHDRLILITSAAQASQFMLHGTLSAFLPLYAIELLQLRAADVGWLVGLQMVTTIAVRPWVGAASDRTGRRPLIAGGLVACAAGVLWLSAVSSLPQLVAAIFLYAVGAATTSASASAFITDITPPARYGAAHGVFGTIYDIGDASGPIAAGLLVALVGYPRMFQLMSAVPLLAAIVFVVTSRGPLHVKS
jgi:MFS family permease